MKSQVLRHFGRTSGHSVAGVVTSGAAALLVVVNPASTTELPNEPMIELMDEPTMRLSTELYELPIELPTGIEVTTAETKVEVAPIADVRSLSATAVVNGAEPVPIGPVAETQPTGIMHDALIQSLAIAQASAGAVIELAGAVAPETAEVNWTLPVGLIGQPAGLIQASPTQSLAIVQVPDGAVMAGYVEEMTPVFPTSPISDAVVEELTPVGPTDPPVADGQPAGITQAPPIQSLAMVQVSDGGVTIEYAEEMTPVGPISPTWDAEELIEDGPTPPAAEEQPTGIMQKPPVQSLAIVQAPDDGVTMGYAEEMTPVGPTSPTWDAEELVEDGLTPPVAEEQPTGIIQKAPVQSLAIVQAPDATGYAEEAIPVVESAEELIEEGPTPPVAEEQPTGIMQKSPVQSLAIVQALDGVVMVG